MRKGTLKEVKESDESEQFCKEEQEVKKEGTVIQEVKRFETIKQEIILKKADSLECDTNLAQLEIIKRPPIPNILARKETPDLFTFDDPSPISNIFYNNRRWSNTPKDRINTESDNNIIT